MYASTRPCVASRPPSHLVCGARSSDITSSLLELGPRVLDVALLRIWDDVVVELTVFPSTLLGEACFKCNRNQFA